MADSNPTSPEPRSRIPKFSELMLEIDVDAIQNEIALGFINTQRHPSAPLTILNYSQKTQYEWRWNDQTMKCRGLIVDDDWCAVARPFPKFFSVEQLGGVVPVEPFEAYEKLDGSLGILYFAEGKPQIATRGSFNSEQAKHATRILDRKYAHVELDESLTYLFEIIYPQNRIVLDYGDMEDLILLAVIDTATGKELALSEIGFPLVKKYDGLTDFDALVAMQEDSREGFVVRFESGERVKIKFEQYKRLHKLLTGVRPRHVWDALRNGDGLDSLLESVPDEFYNWIREVENDLTTKYKEIEENAKREMRFDGDRKELAQYFAKCQYPSVMFSMLDGKDHSSKIWPLIKPERESAFRCGE